MSKVGELLAKGEEATATGTAAYQARAVANELMSVVEAQQSSIEDGRRVAIALAGQPDFDVRDIGYSGGALVVFRGTDRNGDPAWVIQHYSQVNVRISHVSAKPEGLSSPNRLPGQRSKSAEGRGMTRIIRLLELAGAACIATLVTLALAGCVAMLALMLAAGRLRDMAMTARGYLPKGA
jgi:hypothetical protein